ncbi:MAG: carboxypeptidase regulatory-like domain-containing protein, partial [Candidatus Stygibacter australis]|nr:carboxypeptidase regulatory-like domain-containing protein [Candidatus Stygibacter australis]
EAHATLFAHSEDIETVIIVADETTDQDFYLQPAPEVEVTGRVVGSDYPDIGLANAIVTLSGMGVHEGITDADGYFNINTVYSSNTYQMTVVAEGYEVLVGEAVIGAGNTDLGDLVVNEIAFPAYDVIATQNDEDTIVDVVWHGPNPSAGNFWDFEADDGEFVANMGWQWGTDSMAGAYSGDNVWGTTLNAQYPNSVSYELVTPEMNIPTDDAVLTFWHWMDIETTFDGGNIKISTDGGSSWNLIQPVGGYNGTAYGLNSEECFNGHDMVWTLITFEIGEYQGEDVMFKFHFGSDSSVTYQGWYIDDVYVGMPEDRLMHPNNPNFHPIANLLPHTNERIIENYNVYRLLLGEEELEDNWEVIAEGLMDTVYTDPSWEFVESDIYKYAVKAEYTNNVLADAAISNWVARDYYTNATVSVHDFFGNPVVDAEAKFMCQTPDPDGVLNEYELLTDAAGEAYFPMIWKGDYNIRVTKENMATYEDEMVPIYEPYTLEIQLTENLNPITGLDYSVLDDDVSLWWSEPADETFFDLDTNDGEFISNDASGWQWGEDGYFGAFTGTHAWVTAINGNYINNANWQLTTPEVAVPGDGQLSFYHNMDCENSWDGGNVKISIDGGTSWAIITPDGGYPDDSIVGLGEPGFTDGPTGWVLATFGLTMYEGETAMFKFHFGTDSSVNTYPGWAIDDVRIGAPLERIFQHYNIYRNGTLIADDVVDPEYTDIDVPDGTYTYGITAFYDSGESEVEEVIIEVYPLDITGYVTASDTPDTTPFEGVSITLENDLFYWETITDANGEFIISSVNGSQTYTITAMFEGYQTWSEEVVVTDEDIDYPLITLLEIINPPYDVLAEVNTEDTECELTWNSPGSWPEYEIIYDDDEAENATAWYDADNERAVWFTAQGGPCWITGGSMHIYDGSWPAGNILTPFTAAVWAYDEATGMPGEMLGSVLVTPTDYFWVSFEFDEPIAIDGTEFFLGYLQGGAYPDCAGIGIDETAPTMGRSYEHYVTGGTPWAFSSYQDFMLRAIIQGPTGREMTVSYDNPTVDFSSITPHKGAVSEHAVNLPQGIQEVGNARYMPVHNTNPFS